MTSPVKIPLYRRDEIVAWAVVDAEDAPSLLAFHWVHRKQGYAIRVDTETGINYGLARQIVGLKGNDPRFVRFADGDPLNCRRANLIVVTPGSAQSSSALSPRPGADGPAVLDRDGAGMRTASASRPSVGGRAALG